MCAIFTHGHNVVEVVGPSLGKVPPSFGLSVGQSSSAAMSRCEPARITSKSGDAVLMSAGDYDSWQETVYLLRSPENAKRLMEAAARAGAGRSAVAKSVDELRWARA